MREIFKCDSLVFTEVAKFKEALVALKRERFGSGKNPQHYHNTVLKCAIDLATQWLSEHSVNTCLTTDAPSVQYNDDDEGGGGFTPDDSKEKKEEQKPEEKTVIQVKKDAVTPNVMKSGEPGQKDLVATERYKQERTINDAFEDYYKDASSGVDVVQLREKLKKFLIIVKDSDVLDLFLGSILKTLENLINFLNEKDNSNAYKNFAKNVIAVKEALILRCKKMGLGGKKALARQVLAIDSKCDFMARPVWELLDDPKQETPKQEKNLNKSRVEIVVTEDSTCKSDECSSNSGPLVGEGQGGAQNREMSQKQQEQQAEQEDLEALALALQMGESVTQAPKKPYKELFAEDVLRNTIKEELAKTQVNQKDISALIVWFENILIELEVLRKFDLPVETVAKWLRRLSSELKQIKRRTEVYKELARVIDVVVAELDIAAYKVREDRSEGATCSAYEALVKYQELTNGQKLHVIVTTAVIIKPREGQMPILEFIVDFANFPFKLLQYIYNLPLTIYSEVERICC